MRELGNGVQCNEAGSTRVCATCLVSAAARRRCCGGGGGGGGGGCAGEDPVRPGQRDACLLARLGPLLTAGWILTRD